MSAPDLHVYLYKVQGGVADDLTPYVTQESSITITDAIEAPHESNMFVAGDVSMSLRDTSARPVRTLLATITPTSMWEVIVARGTSALFRGFILPNTLQFDDREFMVSFTAAGRAILLTRTKASDVAALKRVPATDWTVKSTQGNPPKIVEIQRAAASSTCEFLAGDTVRFTFTGGQTIDAQVTDVRPVGTSSPYASWNLFVEGLTQAIGADTAVTLQTVYLRNVKLKTAVDALLVGAGLPPTSSATFLITALSNAAAPFGSQPVMDNFVGTPIGVAAQVSGAGVYCGTENGYFRQVTPPTSAWSGPFLSGQAMEPVDWRDRGNGTYVLYGPRYEEKRPVAGTVEMYHYGYDYGKAALPTYRYVLKLTMDKENDELGVVGGNTYTWTREVYRELTSDGYTWGFPETLSPSGGGTTTTNLVTMMAFGIDVDSGTRNAFWTEPLNSGGAGSPLTSQLSGFNFTLNSLTSGLVADVFGPVECSLSPGIGVYDVHSREPVARFWVEMGGLSLIAAGSTPIPRDFYPATLKYNLGDGYWYALAGDGLTGVYLQKFTNAKLATVAGYQPVQIAGRTGRKTVGRVSLAVAATAGVGAGTWGMMALVGTELVWISRTYSGVIPYLDLDGLNCAEALAQLASLIDGYFYLGLDLRSWFRGREQSSLETIGTSAAIDDAQCLSLKTQPVWSKTLRYIRVVNENDETIYGEAGDAAFRDGPLALEITNRYVTPLSLAQSLAQQQYLYFGRQLAAVEAEHVDDGRTYEVGKLFTATIGGVVKTLQIQEVRRAPIANTLVIAGSEV